MSKYLKDLISNDLKKRLDGVTDLLVVDVMGMNSGKTVELRKQLRKEKINLLVVKNSLARRATEGTVLAPAFEGVDGAGGQSMFPRMWERMKLVVDNYFVVTLEETKNAMRLMAEKARVISEGAGALPLAAALTGKAGKGPIVAIVSGGNIDLNKFCELIAQ